MIKTPMEEQALIEVIKSSVKAEILTAGNGIQYATGKTTPLPTEEDVKYDREYNRRARQRLEEKEIKLLKWDEEHHEREKKLLAIQDAEAARELERKKKLQEHDDKAKEDAYNRDILQIVAQDEDNTEERTRRKKLQAIEDAKYKIPDPQCLDVASLKGVVDFIRQHKQDSFHVAPAMIQVQGYNKVAVFSDIQKSGQRVKFCSAECMGVTESNFKFGAYYDQEYMTIALQTLFVPTPTTEALLKIVGNVKSEATNDAMDDGISQSVAVKSGIASVAKVKLPNPVKLLPFRTFIEVQQPESICILRMRKGKEGPEFAFFVADGGLWAANAIQGIKEYLAKQELGLPIIG